MKPVPFKIEPNKLVDCLESPTNYSEKLFETSRMIDIRLPDAARVKCFAKQVAQLRRPTDLRVR